MRIPVVLAAVAVFVSISTDVHAQGCVRPLTTSGTSPDVARGESPWQATVGYRYFQSNRHFVGTDEQEHRQREGSEVINDVSLYTLGATYRLDSRWLIGAELPYQT